MCVCILILPEFSNVWTNFYETSYITAPEPICTVYFINPSHQYVPYRCVYSLSPLSNVPMNFLAAMSTLSILESLLELFPCAACVSDESLWVCLSPSSAMELLSKHVIVLSKKCWKRFLWGTFRLKRNYARNGTWGCKIWGFHGGDYEEWCLLGCYAVWLL
jgi:hypothetical protein